MFVSFFPCLSEACLFRQTVDMFCKKLGPKNRGISCTCSCAPPPGAKEAVLLLLLLLQLGANSSCPPGEHKPATHQRDVFVQISGRFRSDPAVSTLKRALRTGRPPSLNLRQHTNETVCSRSFAVQDRILCVSHCSVKIDPSS